MAAPLTAPPIRSNLPAAPWRRARPASHLADRLLSSILLAACLFPIPLSASTRQAEQFFQSRQYDLALREYERLLGERPGDPRLMYNAGTAAYKAGQHETARKYLNDALASPDLDLQEKAYYNLGSTLYRIGDDTQNIQQRQQSWEQSLRHFDSALKLDARDEDARFNRELVRRQLEELKKQQDQQQQQQSDQPDSDPNQEQDSNARSQNQPQDQPNSSSSTNQNSKPEESSRTNQAPSQSSQPQPQNSPTNQPPAQPEPQPESQEAGSTNAPAGPTNQIPSAVSSSMTNQPSAQEDQMTPQQAAQLLDSHQSQEKALLFAPPGPQSGTNRSPPRLPW